MKISKKEVEELMDMLERPVLAYIRQLMNKAGNPVTEEEAENILGNIGVRRYLKNISRK